MTVYAFNRPLKHFIQRNRFNTTHKKKTENLVKIET